MDGRDQDDPHDGAEGQGLGQKTASHDPSSPYLRTEDQGWRGDDFWLREGVQCDERDGEDGPDADGEPSEDDGPPVAPGCALARRTLAWTTGTGELPLGPPLLIVESEVILVVRVFAASIDYGRGGDVSVVVRAVFDAGAGTGRVFVGEELARVSLASATAGDGAFMRAPLHWPLPVMAQVYLHPVANAALGAQSATIAVEVHGAVVLKKVTSGGEPEPDTSSFL